jgi:hypothetical protein
MIHHAAQILRMMCTRAPMGHANTHFSAAEYARRIDKTRREMDRRGIDLLFVTDPSNQAWLTGYDGWSFYVHQGVILPGDGEPHLVGPDRTRTARANRLDGTDIDPRLPRPLRPIDGVPSDGRSCRASARDGKRYRAHRGGDGELLLLGQGPCGAGDELPDADA